ncbi:SCO2322 family protein [uncultured Streptomyces sp.]|uniref:SCO2322 family protein n=1 Tax=uncultured Streptomyces sp. TaxID=174707 RepID=UPI00261382DC|nr:SCO2322 family protein [uncultured Streptomyces sp.]
MRPLRGAVLLVLSVVVVGLLGAGSASATGYRYWSFWEGDGGKGWTYAAQGPSTVRPQDGAVQGFRFSVSEDSQDSAQPRRAPDFAAVCADTPAADGSKRVALVIDPGTAADAPEGERPPAARTACARVSPDASTAEALASVARPLRYDSAAILCAISGYPRAGCGEQVAPGATEEGTDQEATGTAEGGPAGGGGSGGPSAGVLTGVGLVVVLGGAAVLRARTRRRR